MSSIANNQCYPKEPSRFEPQHIDELLVWCYRVGASDITIQTGSPIVAEVYGRIWKITRRELSSAEVGDLLNAIYGPNGTTQIMRGQDLDTHYEVRPNRNERYRHRVNGTGCHVDGHEAIQITIRTIPSEPPSLAQLELPPEIVDAIASRDPEAARPACHRHLAFIEKTLLTINQRDTRVQRALRRLEI